MHRDIARLLVLLAVVRVLTIVGSPAPKPPPTPRHWDVNQQLSNQIIRRRPAAPKSSRDFVPCRYRDGESPLVSDGVTSDGASSCPQHPVIETLVRVAPEPRATARGPPDAREGSPEPLSVSPPAAAPYSLGAAAPYSLSAATQECGGGWRACHSPAAPRVAPSADAAPPGSAPSRRAAPARSGGRRPQRRGARGRGRRGGRRPDTTDSRPNVSRNLRIGALNIQSLKPKLSELTHELSRNDYDVMLLSETWLRPTTPNRLLSIPGYTISRVDRRDGRGYGGVAIIIKAGIISTALKLPSSERSDSQLESQWAMLKLDQGRQLVICTVYRPPRHSETALQADFADLEAQLQRVVIDYPRVPVVICGDINCDLLKDSSFRARQHLSNFLSDYSLEQIVTVSTFPSGSLLDVCMVNNRELIRNSSVEFCHFSPHKFISLDVNVPKQRLKPTVITSRSLNRVDVAALNHDLLFVDWGKVFSAATVSEQWDTFLDSFLPIVDDHAPLKRVTIRNPTAPPVSAATRDLMSQRRAALRYSGRQSTEYKQLNRSVRAAIRRDRRIEIERDISDRGPNKVWQCIKSVIGGKRDGQCVQPNLPADDLNSFFVSVGPRIATEIRNQNPDIDLSVRLPRVGACGFQLRAVTLDELRHTVFGMRNSGACGTDGVCIRMLKAGFPAIGGVILHIINSCINHSDIPDPWKHSTVRPIFKSGNPSDPSNFRPISLVPVIMKVVERIVYQQLYRYLSHNNLLASSQHGFRSRHSTETALLSVTDRILAATDRGEISILCLLDLSKCFDVIDHELLLQKLMLHGIEISWFTAYLRGHTQSVSVNDGSGRRVLSRPLANDMGVFQGSALGPLLFTIFSNNLSLYAGDAAVLQYADDTQVLVSGPAGDLRALISRMEVALASLSEWFRTHALKVNAGKTQLMVFGSRPNLRKLPEIKVTFCDATLQPCEQVGNLGVVFDGALSWEAHVSELSRRCTGLLIGLSHARHCLPDGVIKILVTALVLSRVNYCLSVYGNGTQKNFDRIQKILNFAARVIFGRRKFDHVSDLRQKLGWMSPRAMSEYQTLVIAHKAVQRGEPEDLAALFTANRDTRERHTRQDHLFHLPRPQLETGKRRFGYRAATLLNRLPAQVVQLPPASFARAARATLSPNNDR